MIEDIASISSVRPQQISIELRKGGGNVLIPLLNRIYFFGGYIPVHETVVETPDKALFLFVKSQCGAQTADAALSDNRRGVADRKQLSLALLELVRKRYGAKLLPLCPANKFLQLYDRGSPRALNAIHQTTRGPQSLKSLSAPSLYAINSWSDMNRESVHVMWYDEDIHKFMKRFFPQYLNTYYVINGVQRSDLFRYLVIYQFGGVYADLDVICFQSAWSLKASSPGFAVANPPQTEAEWKAKVDEAFDLFPHHPMISNLRNSPFHNESTTWVEPTVLWHSNGNMTEIGAVGSSASPAQNVLYIGEERTTVDRPDMNLMYPIQYLQWWFMASAPFHSALLGVAEDIDFKVKTLHMDVRRPSRPWNNLFRSQFTLWLTGITFSLM